MLLLAPLLLAPARFAEGLIVIPPGKTLDLDERQQFAHYRIAARFVIPKASLARLRARGNFPELELRSRDSDDFSITATTIAIRRHKNLPEAGRKDRNGCGFPTFPGDAEFRVEGVCDFVLGGNKLRKRMIIARSRDLLHIFSATYRAEREAELAGMFSGLQFTDPWDGVSRENR